MRIDRTGKIAGEFHVLGHAAAPIYLLNGRNPILFDAGFTGLLNLYVRQIKSILGDRSPAFLFLTHSHWDHVGAAGYLKDIWPEMVIGASLKTSQILARRKALATIKALNQNSLQALQSWGISEIHDGEFKPFGIDKIVEDGQQIEIEDGITIQIFFVPGHTWDSTAYYIKEPKILIAGEAAGCDGICDFLVDHEIYVKSMKFLAGLKPEILCVGHRYVFTGPDIQENITGPLRWLTCYVDRVKQYLTEENGDVERVVNRIKAADWDEKPTPKQPLEPYLINTRLRVKALLNHMSG